MTVSRAMVQTAVRHMEMAHFPVPEAIAPGQILLRVEANGVCGSDVSHYAGSFGAGSDREYPVVRGHEAVGHVAAITPEAVARWGVATGDRIVVEPVAPCRRCGRCAREAPELCERRFVYGRRPIDADGALWGAFSEYMLVHPGSRVHLIPDSIPIAEAALHNALAGGFEWTVRAAGTEPGDDVVILGPGLRGIAGAMAAQEAGARNIVMIGRGDPRKAELARAFGATHVLDSRTTDIVASVREICGGGAQRIVDLTPHAPWAMNAAIDMAALGATIVVVGVKGAQVPIASDQLLHKALTVRGVNGPGDWGYDRAIETIVARRRPLHLLHTHRFSLDQADRAITTLEGGGADELALGVCVTA
ncbi:alcohol dehydrogenase catalytic domain-containing protein [Sphingomonas sp.]|uniref:zinc-dependent alcohol dehydrogenase n=1 Tax=Sphingomonas sp. TaxID=28214 RepID=UPI001EC98791|nr:alcohol dehydrogenase catalytic domain-containing protein [Sphingomonas sp.]MBX3595024.1 alcohol dehydrogenase catalytic domain-containing protein [Sphingomonas sp.]